MQASDGHANGERGDSYNDSKDLTDGFEAKKGKTKFLLGATNRGESQLQASARSLKCGKSIDVHWGQGKN